MCFPPLSWQTFDLDLTDPKFDDSGNKVANARITVRHNGVAPGYPADNIGAPVSQDEFRAQMVDGGYLQKMPKNSFNNLDTLDMIPNGAALPAEATGGYGWIYQPQSKTIRLDWPGTDRKGIRYCDY